MIFVFNMLKLLEQLDASTLKDLGSRIYHNECRGNPEYLVHWNNGEDFISLGIGHFIWYPRGVTGIYTEVFPQFINYLRQKNIALPEYLPLSPPWPTRPAFLREQHGTLALRLRDFLLRTINFQAEFILHRTGVVLEDKFFGNKVIVAKLEILLQAPDGVYPVIDYLNFKGDGTAVKERYRGQGWGLLQVLETMPSAVILNPVNVRQHFVAATQRVLKQRVTNAPPERHEERWLPGWLKRVASY